MHSSIELTARDREIMRDVVRSFIMTGAPVSSRSVSKRQKDGLSAATIRNTMADLEEAGLLTQPHTSAGRVPTEAGYHLYIDSLMTSRDLSSSELEYIEESLPVDSDGESLVTKVPQVLSELSHQIAIVLTPAVADTVLRAVHFIPLSSGRVLCVIESADGFVDHKIVQRQEEASAEELTRISNYITEQFAGMSLVAARDRLLGSMAEERAEVSRLMSDAISLAQAALGEETPELLVEGTAAVLSLPELGDVERIRRLVDKFEDKASLVSILNSLIHGNGVRVIIGGDSDLTSDLDFSLVAKQYGVGSRSLGTLGIFGPSRMPYQKVIPLVDYLGERLSRALEASFAE